MNARALLAGYRLCFCGLILVASAQTLSGLGVPRPPLAAAEILGALLLLSRRTQWADSRCCYWCLWGAAVAALEQLPTRFPQYVSCALTSS